MYDRTRGKSSLGIHTAIFLLLHLPRTELRSGTGFLEAQLCIFAPTRYCEKILRRLACTDLKNKTASWEAGGFRAIYLLDVVNSLFEKEISFASKICLILCILFFRIILAIDLVCFSLLASIKYLTCSHLPVNSLNHSYCRM